MYIYIYTCILRMTSHTHHSASFLLCRRRLLLYQFSDWTEEEVDKTLRGVGYDPNRTFDHMPVYALEEGANATKAPDSWDWRQQGKMTRVKSQGQCGSCWAFAATATVEAAWAIKGGHPLTDFSPQHLVDCSRGNHGCNGGYYDRAYHYVNKHGGMAKESSYPYKEADNQCPGRGPPPEGGTVSKWGLASPPCHSGPCVDHECPQCIAQVIAQHGPVAVYVDSKALPSYTGGLMTHHDCSSQNSDRDHVVVIVGYNTAARPRYWIVRNSWGENWGENGHFRVKIGKNVCGIGNEPGYIMAI